MITKQFGKHIAVVFTDLITMVSNSRAKAIKGGKLPKAIDTGYYRYDNSAMNDPKIATVFHD